MLMPMKKFFYKDKSGRGFTNTLDTTDLLRMEDEQDNNDTSLHEFAENAEEGDEWETASIKLTCIDEN